MVQGIYQPSSAATIDLSQYSSNGAMNTTSVTGRSRKQINPKKYGVRRYRRYLNKLWLLQGAEDVDLQEEDFVPFEPQSRESGFSKLFTDSTAWNLMLPFSDCTEEEENILYMTLIEHRKGQKSTSNNNNNVASPSKSPKEKLTKYEPSTLCTETYESEEFYSALKRADGKFNQLDKKVRRVLQNDPKSKLLESVELQLVNYLETEQNNWQSLTLNNAEDGLERTLTHGICRFYSFQSKCESVSDQLVVLIRKSSHSVEVPMKLSTYLTFVSIL